MRGQLASNLRSGGGASAPRLAAGLDAMFFPGHWIARLASMSALQHDQVAVIRSSMHPKSNPPGATLQKPLNAYAPCPRADKSGCTSTSPPGSRNGGLTKASPRVGVQTREVSLPVDCTHHMTVRSLESSHLRAISECRCVNIARPKTTQPHPGQENELQKC